MTIAAGFCYDNGILLCADSQYTGSAKINQTKIFPIEYEGGRAVFALAGNEAYAKQAIQESEHAVRRKGRRWQNPSGVKKIIGDVVRSVYLDHIDLRPPSEQYDSQIFLLVAVWGSVEGLHLYATRKTAIFEVDGYDCIGIGDYLARFIVGPVYEEAGASKLMRGKSSLHISQRQAAVLALEAMAAIKRHDPNCGGASELVAISSDGSMSPIGYYHLVREIPLAEEILSAFRERYQKLLLQMTNPQLNDEEFTAVWQESGKWLNSDLRYRWKLASKYGLASLLGESFPEEPEIEPLD